MRTWRCDCRWAGSGSDVFHGVERVSASSSIITCHSGSLDDFEAGGPEGSLLLMPGRTFTTKGWARFVLVDSLRQRLTRSLALERGVPRWYLD